MGDAHFCFHPEHEVDLALHESLTTVDEKELALLPPTALRDKGDAGFCFHPEHEVDLALHESLTTIDTFELRRHEPANARVHA
jgi:hypothetical protein